MGCITSVPVLQTIEFEQCLVTGMYHKNTFNGMVMIEDKAQRCSFYGPVVNGKLTSQVEGRFKGTNEVFVCSYLNGVKPEFAVTHLGTWQTLNLISLGGIRE